MSFKKMIFSFKKKNFGEKESKGLLLKGLLLRDPEGIARQDTQNGYKYKKHVREILREVRRCSLCSALTPDHLRRA